MDISIDVRTRTAGVPPEVDPAAFDLVVLGMQEAQYAAGPVRALMGRLARARVPSLAIMNMPPLAYLRRIPALAGAPLEDCYADSSVWEGFDPALVTLASPDPQAIRPPEEKVNVLQVTLPTNFKVARFDDDASTRILHDLAAAQLPHMPLAYLRTHLERDAAAIGHDVRDRPARQRTVSELIGWSSDQLTPSGQRLFARLGLNTRPDGTAPEAFGRFSESIARRISAKLRPVLIG